jgi:flavorubredoxin
MDTRTTEIAAGIYQLTTFPPGAPLGFNQYLIADDQPLLFHTGLRALFPNVSGAVTTVLPVSSLRYITFGHVEADECGSMNSWLAAAPHATVAQGAIGCLVSLNDLADRPPTILVNGEDIDLGGHVVRWYDTPHVPHAWEAGVLYDATTRTLLCGDLFTRAGDSYPATTSDDIVAPALEAEDMFHAYSLHPSSGPQIRKLADLDIGTLALMHGPAFTGDCRAALLALADDADKRVANAG